MITLQHLNQLSQADFVDAVGFVFEHSPWVAERSWQQRPFASLEHLHGQMTRVVEDATRDEQLALLRAHPDLGTRARISSSSTNEQAGAGLDKLTAEEYGRLSSLNSGYRGRFGFPFLYAVKGSDKFAILQALERRSQSDMDQEFREALLQVYRIARFRLEDSIEH